MRLAFAGDDVQAEFAAAKAAEVGEELPPADVAAPLPGWGQWAGRSRQPAWLAAAKDKALKCALHVHDRLQVDEAYAHPQRSCKRELWSSQVQGGSWQFCMELLMVTTVRRSRRLHVVVTSVTVADAQAERCGSGAAKGRALEGRHHHGALGQEGCQVRHRDRAVPLRQRGDVREVHAAAAGPRLQHGRLLPVGEAEAVRMLRINRPQFVSMYLII